MLDNQREEQTGDAEWKKACFEIAFKNKIGGRLITGHKAGYFFQAHELVVGKLKQEIAQLKEQLANANKPTE